MTAFEAAYGQQAQALTFARFAPQLVSRTIEDWVARFKTEQQADNLYWWAKGLAVMAYPLLPTLSVAIWHALGYDGEVSHQAFLSQTTPVAAGTARQGAVKAKTAQVVL
jgi:methionyl-tRNA synthetase